MTLGAALTAGRLAAEARMGDTCRVGTWQRSDEPDPDTLEYTYELVGIVYTGRCEFKVADRVEAQNVDAAGQLLVSQYAELRLPIEAVGVEKGMRVVIDSSDSDPALPGTVARVEAPFLAAHTTARRFTVQVVD